MNKLIIIFLTLILQVNGQTINNLIKQLNVPDFNDFRKRQEEALSMALKPVEDEKGRTNIFLGEITVKWLDEEQDDRKMKILNEFTFIDNESIKWKVPKNWVIDGASIPKIFWTLIGSPFIGDYRKASVVHDYYCDVKTTSWEKIHRMFYDACIVAGVSIIKAKIMYFAVYAGGPRWEKQVVEIHNTKGANEKWVTFNTWKPEYDESKLVEISKWIEKNNPNIEEIENRIFNIK